MFPKMESLKVGGRLTALWLYRGFVLGMVARDFRGRYLRSVLGASWAVLNPLAQILVYTAVFSHVMQARLPNARDPLSYSLYLCAGLLTWGYFVEVLLRNQTVFLEQANMMKKVSFPRVTLPSYVFLSASVNFAIVWGLFLATLLVSGRWPGWVLVALVPLLLIQQVLAAGLGLVLGVINMFFRDVGHAVGIALQFWFWLTPIVYQPTALGPRLTLVMENNPITPFILGVRGLLVDGALPAAAQWAWMAAWAGGLCLAGAAMLQRLRSDLRDAL
jgi:lipopolysaccharide transport system permease protein